jgi:hypothetical protein
VLYDETGSPMPLVIITYSLPNRYSRQSVTVRAPVPHGHEEEAVRIIAALRDRIKK